MKATIATSLWACLLCVLAPAIAQDRCTAEDLAPAIEPVLDHVPAGATAFLVIHDIAFVTGKVDKFLAEIGLGEAMAQAHPQGMLGLFRQRCLLGKGFEPRGGLAIVWPDANEFPLDVLGLMEGRKPAVREASPQAPAAAGGEALPFVIFVPGKGVQDVFPGLAVVEEGPYERIRFPRSSMVACQAGGYIALSPSAKALGSVLGAAGKYPGAAGADELEFVRRGDFVLHVNTKLAGPALDRVLRQVEAELNEELAEPLLFLISPWSLPVAWIGPQMPFYRQALRDMDSLTVAARMDSAGVVMDFLAEWNPQSLFARCGGSGEAAHLLDSLPDQKHLLAIWSAPPGTEAGEALEDQRVEAMLSNANFQMLPRRWHEDVKTLHQELAQQVQSWEFVLGGGGPEGGLFSAALAIRCRDSQKTKALVVQAARLVAEMANAAGGTEEDRKYVVENVPARETIANVPVDAIEISTPVMKEMDEYLRAILQKAFGEDKVRVLLAEVEPNQLLVTMGGARAFMGRAIAAAARGGAVRQCAGTKAALQYLPPHCTTLAVFNAGNALEVILGATHAFAGGLRSGTSPVHCKVPLAFGNSAVGTHQHAALFVPIQLIRETMDYFKPADAPATRP